MLVGRIDKQLYGIENTPSYLHNHETTYMFAPLSISSVDQEQ